MANARSAKTMWQDHNISYKAQYNLNNDTTLKLQKGAVNISTAAFDHMLLLVGEVPTAELKQHAEDIAKKIPGVKVVYNQIVVGPPVISSTKSNDTWITTKVKNALLFTKNIDSNQIKVVTEDGVVYLMGTASKKQGTVAAKAASQVSGVKKVVKIFIYTD